jgi:hypothetical protein
MLNYVIYPNPLETEVYLTADNGASYVGEPYTDITGRIGKVIHIAEGSTGMGGELKLKCPGYIEQRYRGILFQASEVACYLLVDDFTLAAEQVDPVQPPIENEPIWSIPLDVINWVHSTGNYDLSTKEGCGLFTEECCRWLHDKNSPMWGHIAKTGGQNQYNGHAVDAIMLMATAWGVQAGGYDIVHDSVSPNASPAFNYAGVADGNLWYYPPAARMAASHQTLHK